MKRTILVIALLLAMVMTSCAPKIYGARPHRRDRNCGCEAPQKTDTLHFADCTTNLI